MQKIEICFLDYRIVNTFNGDGWVLMSKIAGDYSTLWESHLGNFRELEDAKKSAVIKFMIKRPNYFHSHITNRVLNNAGLYMEWFTFIKVLKIEGLDIPPELTHSKDSNFSLLFNGEEI